ncbi:GNAT family N-acetyltransferase [soil metagenome]
MEIRQLSTDEEIKATYPVMNQLRHHLKKESYPTTVRRMADSDGYRLAAAFEGERVCCVAGYRISEFLAYGKVLYVDDLVTDEAARSRDFGGHMIGWLANEAQRHGCGQLHLDSSVQRHDAHRFYFREGMKISSYHFVKDF